MAYTVWANLDQVERYARRRYRHWDQRQVNQREQRLVRKLFKRHELGAQILDAPVGYGRFQQLLNEFGTVKALDFNYYAALYQLQRIALASDAVTGLAEALPFQDSSFDLIFSFRLMQHMHHSSEHRAIYREFKRVSRRWVVISHYQKTTIHRLHRLLFRQPSRITMQSRAELLAETSQAGLSLIQSVAVLPGVHAHHISLFSTQ